MKNARMTICLVAAVLVTATGQGFGWTQYKDGGTHNISSTINDDVWVDYLAPGMQTTVNLLNGGYIPSPYKLQGYNDSRINMSGGSVGDLYAYNSSQVTMNSGSVSILWAHDNSQVTMNSGSVSNLWTQDSSQVTMNNGSVSNLQTMDSSQVTMNSGSVNNFWAYSGQVTMSGGSVSGNLWAYSSSQVTMNSGSVNNFWAYDSSRITMSGGSVSGVLGVHHSSLVNWSGGSVEQYLEVGEMAALTIYGSNFAIDGIPFVSGEITSILGGSYSSEPFRRLTGTLANGDIINNQFQIGDYASITLIPEPASLLLLVLGGILAIRKK
jgi:hypothetical protein